MSAWGKVDEVVQTVSFQVAQDEELARKWQNKECAKAAKETKKARKKQEQLDWCSKVKEKPAAELFDVATGSMDDQEPGPSSSASNLLPDVGEVLDALEKEHFVESDEVIAMLLQAEFDLEYDEKLQREEKAKNKNSKVAISYKNHRLIPEDLVYEEMEDMPESKDWDNFETNEKEQKTIPRCGYKLDDEGEMVTKHDAIINGRRNACKVMSFPPEFSTGDGASFDMKLSNQVFNQLRSHSNKSSKKMHRAQDRKENIATAEMGLDEPTRLILYKLINNQTLESIDGIISTGKEAVVLHGETDPTNPNIEEGKVVPKEVAIKIFSTTLNEFKQRDRYIKDDYRFHGRFSKQNARTVINMWAEKELHNLSRMKRAGIACPDVVVLKKNILIMSFIGKDMKPAPKLKEVILSDAELIVAYEEIVEVMVKLYNEARLVHADLSEYNILWYDDHCWIIDVAQSVEPSHPGALEFLMRDCDNISTFFSKRQVPGVKTKEELFFYITNLDPLTHNTTMLERIHMKGQPVHKMTQPENEDIPDQLKPLEYPFDYAWEKVEKLKNKRKTNALTE